MVLVRMGGQGAEIAPLLHEVTDVGKDQLDTGQLIPGESDPHVDEAIQLRRCSGPKP